MATNFMRFVQQFQQHYEQVLEEKRKSINITTVQIRENAFAIDCIVLNFVQMLRENLLLCSSFFTKISVLYCNMIFSNIQRVKKGLF